MQIVIDIPKEIYDYIHNEHVALRVRDSHKVAKAIANGAPLPKGHGALKDVDNIKTAFPSGEYVRTESVRATIDHEDTIIEADKEESEDKQ